MAQAALPHMRKGAAIVNTASVTAYRGSPRLVDYASIKGAIVPFTRSLSAQLTKKGIRVKSVAPGPIRCRTGCSSRSFLYSGDVALNLSYRSLGF